VTASLFNRLLNASPRSAARWIGRRLGFSSSAINAVRPRWERVVAGPLAGREIFIDRRGSGAWDDMLAGRFDAEIYDAIAQALPESGGIVWDVGSHIGFHTLGFCTLVGSNGRVIGFEPNPSNRERLHQNIARNPDLATRIEILPCCLADEDGNSLFALSHDIDSGASSMSFLAATDAAVDPATSASWDRQVIPVRTADALVRDGLPRPDVIKIDVEGAELLVLRGATKTIESEGPTVIVETHSAGLVFQVTEWFETHSYRVRLLADLAPSRVLLHARPASPPPSNSHRLSSSSIQRESAASSSGAIASILASTARMWSPDSL
jgi:FkbM family methyltransferase